VSYYKTITIAEKSMIATLAYTKFKLELRVNTASKVRVDFSNICLVVMFHYGCTTVRDKA